MRVKPGKGITTKEGAISAMARLDEIDRELAGWYLSEAEAVAAARAAHTAKQVGRTGYEAEKALLVKQLEEWAEEASANWETRSFETPAGKMGFRMAPPSVALIKRVAKKFENAVELLMLNMPEFVRKVFEVDKEAILAADRAGNLAVDALGRCGLEIKQDDEFWVETGASKDLDAAAKRLKGA